MRKKYALEYGVAEIEVQGGDVPRDGSILLMDDLIATGGTFKAAAELIGEAGGKVTDAFAVIGLPDCNYADLLKGITVKTLINYEGG
jgi:adenine phosphoribosyltransferase